MIISVCMCPGKQHSFLPAWTLTGPSSVIQGNIHHAEGIVLSQLQLFPHLFSKCSSLFLILQTHLPGKILKHLPLIKVFSGTPGSLFYDFLAFRDDHLLLGLVYSLFTLYLQSLLMDFIYCLHLKSGNPMKIAHRSLIPTDLYRFPALTLRNCVNLVKLLNFSMP